MNNDFIQYSRHGVSENAVKPGTKFNYRDTRTHGIFMCEVKLAANPREDMIYELRFFDLQNETTSVSVGMAVWQFLDNLISQIKPNPSVSPR